jgi:cytochrome bd-type quinol oxidase subunit 2
MYGEPIDFTKATDRWWRIHRIVCASMLVVYHGVIAAAISLVPTETDSDEAGLAWANDHHFVIIGLFGFLGCALYVSLQFVKATRASDMPIRWYVLRPFQSVLLSFFIYLAVRAGQLTLFSGGGQVDEDNINLYALGLVAALTGIFSEQAYLLLESLARKAFKVDDSASRGRETGPESPVEASEGPGDVKEG